ncbi:MAG TPA: hypothetical protein VK253_05765, partial [Candidatus Binatia bacterium]|nr:hypothetical protein [Candidatus Binatia bacterium]
MNLKILFIPEKLSYELTHVLNRIVLFPMILVTFLNFFLVMGTYAKKMLLTTGFLLLFVGLEWLADSLGVLLHVHWRIWWSFAFWLIALSILIGFMKFFRKILYKGGLNS